MSDRVRGVIELQKQTRQNAIEVNEFVESLSSWTADMKEIEAKKSKLNNNPNDSINQEASQVAEVSILPIWTKENWIENSKKSSDVPLNESVKIKQKLALQLKELGNKYFSRANYEKAIENYTSGIQKDPTQGPLYSNRAQAYINIQKYKEAEVDSNSAVGLEPKNVKSIFRRMKSRAQLSDYSKAQGDYLKIMELDPTNEAALKLYKDLLTSSQSQKS